MSAEKIVRVKILPGEANEVSLNGERIERATAPRAARGWLGSPGAGPRADPWRRSGACAVSAGEFLVGLPERLRAELLRREEIAQRATAWRVTFGTTKQGVRHRLIEFANANDPAFVLRTIQAHRAILDRHGPGVSHPEECGRCNDPFPCGDLRALASIYFPESDA